MARQARAIRTRANLIHAAGARFADRGYSRTTVAEVAAEAGVGLGTLLFHFNAKHQLAEVVYEASEDLISEELDRVSGTGYAGVARLFTRLAELFGTSPVLRAGLRLSAESAAELGWEPARPQRIMIERAQELLMQASKPGEANATTDASTLAAILVDGFTGASALSAALTNGQDLPERITRMLPLLLVHKAG